LFYRRSFNRRLGGQRPFLNPKASKRGFGHPFGS